MPIGWGFAPYKRINVLGNPVRYCAVEDFRASIAADGGGVAFGEILGGYAIAKVSASAATLTAIAGSPGFQRFPPGLDLTDTLASLTAGQKTTLRDFVTNTLGYPLAELQAALPNDLGTYTIADVVNFCRRRRLRPRYDAATDTIVLDGPQDPVVPLAAIAQAVP